MYQIAIVARLKDGVEAQAAELIRQGPPLDLASAGFERHHVFLSATEVVFVFEGHEVEWTLDKLVGDPFQWMLNEALSTWKDLLEAPPRIARPLYVWERA